MQVRTDWMDAVAVRETFQRMERYCADDIAIGQILEEYVRDEPGIFNKAAIELRLTAHLMEAEGVDGLERLECHGHLASRPSCALLTWTVDQVGGDTFRDWLPERSINLGTRSTQSNVRRCGCRYSPFCRKFG